MEQIEITGSAILKIADILAEENKPNTHMRAFVQGGGCSGFSYGFTLDDTQNDDDIVIRKPGMTLLVDAMSMQYMQGATLDYVEELMGSHFVIKNPNATTTCGCGSSFSV